MATEIGSDIRPARPHAWLQHVEVRSESVTIPVYGNRTITLSRREFLEAIERRNEIMPPWLAINLVRLACKVAQAIRAN